MSQIQVRYNVNNIESLCVITPGSMETAGDISWRRITRTTFGKQD